MNFVNFSQYEEIYENNQQPNILLELLQQLLDFITETDSKDENILLLADATNMLINWKKFKILPNYYEYYIKVYANILNEVKDNSLDDLKKQIVSELNKIKKTI